MAILNCGQCGAVLPPQTGPTLVCGYCGTPQTGDEPAPSRVWLRDDWVTALLRKNVTGADYTWIHPSIPATKLANVRALHGAHLPPGETILALYDGTVFGSARDGFLVTAQRLCWKNQLEEPQFLEWIHIPESGVTVDGKRIAIGNARIDTFFSAGHAHLWGWARVLDSLAKATHGAPASLPPPVIPSRPSMPWHLAIPYTDPATAPLVAPAEAVHAVDVAWQRLELSSGTSTQQYVEIAQWFHRGFRAPDRMMWVWIGLSETFRHLAYSGGDCYYEEGLEWSLSLVDRALALAPDCVDARALKAETLIVAQRYPEAGEALAGLPVDHWRVALAIARLCRTTQNPISRRKAWRTVVDNAPMGRRAELLDRMATELFELGRVDAAFAAMQESIALRPDRAWAHHNLAMMYAHVGQREYATVCVHRALALAEVPAARALEHHLRTATLEPRPPPRIVNLCRACGEPKGGAPCSACGASEGVHDLTEVEIASFRQIPCPSCARELIGFATRCPHCKQSWE